jgi:hypothetical protein
MERFLRAFFFRLYLCIVVAATLLLAPSLLATTTLDQSNKDKKAASEPTDKSGVFEDRIVTPEEIAASMRPKGSGPFLVLGWPFGKLFSGMEKGLIAFEKNKIREKLYDWQRKLGAAGFRPLFGGMGEGSGMGLGTVYQFPPAVQPQSSITALQLLGRMSFLSGYQEFAANFLSSPISRTNLILLTNYQWRPNEPYYGFGQNSSIEDASSFALRQTAISARWEQQPIERFSFGTEYTISFLKALGTTKGTRPSIEDVFGADVPGLNERTQLQSIGVFLGANGLRGEYGLGGRVQLGASWQDSFGEGDIRYALIEGRLEGRLPIAPRRSVLVAQASTVLTREDSGTDPLPFYLYPRIGGSTTLRGFTLDRFYGRNMIAATLEYRVAIHPNMEFQIFFDEGQIFQHTEDLRFLDWHRNFGVGLRFRNRTGTQFRIEFSSSDEGFTVHISFGGRPPRPLIGPVRYPNYRP